MQFNIKLCKTNRPPHSAVRAPGKFESPIIMEHIIEHVAARLNLESATVRERNFLPTPPPGLPPTVSLTMSMLLLYSMHIRAVHDAQPMHVQAVHVQVCVYRYWMNRCAYSSSACTGSVRQWQYCWHAALGSHKCL